MGKFINLRLSSEMDNQSVVENDEFFYTDVFAIRPGEWNGNLYTKESIENAAKSANLPEPKPLLTSFPNGEIGGGHDKKVVYNINTGETEYDLTYPGAERPVGFTLKDRPARIFERTLMNGDVVSWLIIPVAIWKYYYPSVVREIKLKYKSVSLELSIMINDFETREDGSMIIKDFVIRGITILGDNVEPAVSGAFINNEILSQSAQNKALSIEKKGTNMTDQEIKELKEKADRLEQELSEQKVESEKAKKEIEEQLKAAEKQLIHTALSEEVVKDSELPEGYRVSDLILQGIKAKVDDGTFETKESALQAYAVESRKAILESSKKTGRIESLSLGSATVHKTDLSEMKKSYAETDLSII